MEHLWTGRPAPWKYMELVLCRDIYHTDPLTLRKIPLEILGDHLAMMDAEVDVQAGRKVLG